MEKKPNRVKISAKKCNSYQYYTQQQSEWDVKHLRNDERSKSMREKSSIVDFDKSSIVDFVYLKRDQPTPKKCNILSFKSVISVLSPCFLTRFLLNILHIIIHAAFISNSNKLFFHKSFFFLKKQF